MIGALLMEPSSAAHTAWRSTTLIAKSAARLMYSEYRCARQEACPSFQSLEECANRSALDERSLFRSSLRYALMWAGPPVGVVLGANYPSPLRTRERGSAHACAYCVEHHSMLRQQLE